MGMMSGSGLVVVITGGKLVVSSRVVVVGAGSMAGKVVVGDNLIGKISGSAVVVIAFAFVVVSCVVISWVVVSSASVAVSGSSVVSSGSSVVSGSVVSSVVVVGSI